jgi:hypothetical protein
MTVVFFLLALSVLVPRLVWTVIDIFLLGNSDGKFSPWASVQFVAVFGGIAACIAGVVGAAFVVIRKSYPYRVHVLSAVPAGLALSLASFWIPELGDYGVGEAIFGEIGMLVVNWGVVCVLVLLVTQRLVGWTLPSDNALERAREG